MNSLKFVISFLGLAFIKLVTHLFYKVDVNFLNTNSKEVFDPKIRALIFFNHTSLYEVLFVAAIPWSFLWTFTIKMVAPGADKTLDRPLVGKFWKVVFPQMLTISRKRDHTWDAFINAIKDQSIVVIAAEGRMKRPNGLDANGKKMTVRGGNIDIIELIDEGKMVMVYSGGLHHVQEPGQTIPKVFKTIKLNIEIVEIKEYKERFSQAEVPRKAMLADLQERLENKCP
jgi:1-acyl-sn-glycerol-3-phosphate acyltransferase